jgi:hypothetical protein
MRRVVTLLQNPTEEQHRTWMELVNPGTVLFFSGAGGLNIFFS